MSKTSGSFDDQGTPTLLTHSVRNAEPWRGTSRDERKQLFDADTAPGACYTYATVTRKGTRVNADGEWETYTYEETIRIPFVTERAERKQRTHKTIERNTARLDRSEVARLADTTDHDYTAQ
jgi:hypothetical protein